MLGIWHHVAPRLLVRVKTLIRLGGQSHGNFVELRLLPLPCFPHAEHNMNHCPLPTVWAALGLPRMNETTMAGRADNPGID